MSWVAAAVVGSSLIGAGVSMYGANKQSQDNAHAQDVNAQQQGQQNNAAWTNWLMTRGVAPNPGGSFTSGQLPGPGESRAVNTRLPLWANVRMGAPAGAAATTGGGAGVAQPFLIRRR
jgi:hypothetical protein